jgi:hypothetical protein
MDRKNRVLWCAVLSCLAVTAIGWAQTTYEDPQGRFVIDLPKGWKYDPMMPAFKNDKTADFQDEGKKNAFTLAISRGFDDPDKLIKQAALQFKFLEPVFDGEILAMTVNGHPARWGVLKTPLDPGMIMHVASIVLEDNGIYLIHTLRTEKRESVGKPVEQAFHSLRLPGEEATGVEGVKAVAGAAAPATAAEPTPWKSKLVSLTLPPGWTETPKPRGVEKEVQGMFANDSLPGVTLIAVGYKGMGMNMAKALDAGIKTFTIPVPNGQPVDVQETEIEGKKINLVVYKGTSVGSGTEVELGAVIVVTKADKCYLNLIAIGQATVISEMRAQVLEIVKTVK